MNTTASDVSARPDRRRLGLVSWAFYDWASSPFTTLIITFIFPAYFGRAIVGDETRGQALWGYAIGASGFVIALLSPVLGAIADAGGRRKLWLGGFTSLCVAASALLWFAEPSRAFIAPSLVLVCLANIGLEFGVAFNNATLPELAPKERIGRWSGWAWTLAYGGGLSALAIMLVAFIAEGATWIALDRGAAEQVRIAGPFVALWFALFAWPRLVFTPDPPATSLSLSDSIKQGLAALRATLAALPRARNLTRFLLAHMFYADALLGIFAFGGIYAAGAFHMTFEEVVTFAIALNITAGVGAFGFAWVDDLIGSRRTILISLAGLIASALGAVVARDPVWFWIAGLGLGLFVGPAQSASRSLMARMTPEGRETEFFGLFALSRRATAFLAPALVGAVTALTSSQRLGLASLLILLVAGAGLMIAVVEPGRQ